MTWSLELSPRTEKEIVDPSISTMLRKAGFAEGTPESELFQRLSETDKQELRDHVQPRKWCNHRDVILQIADGGQA